MTEANGNTSSLTKQRQKQWQKLMVIPLVLQNKDKNNVLPLASVIVFILVL
jgi:hypothetical protein